MAIPKQVPILGAETREVTRGADSTASQTLLRTATSLGIFRRGSAVQYGLGKSKLNLGSRITTLGWDTVEGYSSVLAALWLPTWIS